MIVASAIARAFEEIIGWPYPTDGSGGSNDERAIDCSGAWVRAMRKHGGYVYHGSNTIYRKHCTETGRIDGDVSRLHVGMAVFKQRASGKEPPKYMGDGMGDMYHIGCVTAVNPLRIVHATDPVAKADTSLGTKTPGKWTHYGRVSGVFYSDEGSADADEDTYVDVDTDVDVAAPVDRLAVVVADNGEPVKLRKDPSTKNKYLDKIAVGTLVTVHAIGESSDGEQWATVTVQWSGKRGYMMAKFLRMRT